MRYFVGFLVTIGLIIILIIMLFGGGNKSDNKVTTVTPRTLDSYASTDAQVSMQINGPVNADSLHQQIRVTVGRDAVTYEEFRGYEGQVVNTKSFENNEAAYAVFLRAINGAGFTLGDKDKKLADERGYCPLGRTYIFTMEEGSSVMQRYWATSCGGTQTYRGNLSLTVTLFQAQVPGYSNLVQNVSL